MSRYTNKEGHKIDKWLKIAKIYTYAYTNTDIIMTQ